MSPAAISLLLLSTLSAVASSLTWTGDGGNALWSNTKNWKEEAVPVDGDTLIFPAGVAQKTPVNDLSGLSVESLTFQSPDYTLAGEGIAVVSGVTASFSGVGAVQLDFPVLVRSAQTWTLAAGNVLSLSAALELHDSLTLQPVSSGFVRIDGVISGAGTLTKAGTGTLFLNGANSFTGACEVQSGTLTLGNAGALGGSASGTFVRANSLLRVAGNIVVPEPLTLDAGAAIENQAGEPEFSGAVALQGSATFRAFTGRLIFSGAVTGPGSLTSVGQTRLTGTVPNSWTGGTTVVAGTLQLGKTPGVNALPGNVSINVNGRLELLASHQISDAASVSLGGTGRLVISSGLEETVGGLTMQAGVVDNAGRLTVNGDVNVLADATASVAGGSIRIQNALTPALGRVWSVAGGAILHASGVLAGDTLHKQGSGELRCSGDGSVAPLLVEAGVLNWQGDSPGSTIVLQGGTLRGTGRAASVSLSPAVSSARLEPGNSLGTFRTAELSGNFALTLGLELNGTVRGADYDSLDVSGSATFGLPRLAVSVGYAAAVGDSFVILNKTSAGPVNGQFIATTVPLSEGSYLAANGGHYFRISYTGGDGNDVVLTKVVPPPAAFTTFTATAGTGNLQGFALINFSATGGAGLTYRIEGSSDLANWSLLTTFPANSAGIIATEFTQPVQTRYFYRLALP